MFLAQAWCSATCFNKTSRWFWAGWGWEATTTQNPCLLTVKHGSQPGVCEPPEAKGKCAYSWGETAQLSTLSKRREPRTVRYHYEPSNSAELTSANIHQAEIFSKPFNIHLNSWGTSNKTAIFVTRKVLCDICIIYQWSQNLYCNNISLTHWSKGWLNRVRKAGRWMVKTWHLLRGKRTQTFTDCLLCTLD